MSDADQVWTLDHEGRTHRVEASGSASHHARWRVDGELVTEKKAWEEKLTLDGAECGRVVVPLLVGLLAIRLAVSIPWPDLPFPDLPDIPWPDLPSIPVPDLPDVGLPDWLRWLLDKAKYVWPIVLAYVVARAEINRRRKQDELRRAQGTTQSEERTD